MLIAPQGPAVPPVFPAGGLSPWPQNPAPLVEHWDDERVIGNGIIFTLQPGHFFYDGCGARAFAKRTAMRRIGHNGGPPLEADNPVRGGKCRMCRHWNAPSETWESEYRHFEMTGRGRRVKRPTGTCDRVLLGGKVAFGATHGDFCCGNFAPKPPAPRQAGGWVTIYENGRIVWQGPEEDQPPEQLDLL